MKSYLLVVLYGALVLVSGKNSTTEIPTPASANTTIAPVTIAPANVTTPAPAPVTTTEPNTTTIAPPVPTGSPDNPPQGHWNFTNNGTTCVVAAMSLQFDIGYSKKNNTNGTVVFDMPANATITSNSTCSGINGTQVLQLKYGNFSWTMYFAKTSNSYSVKRVMFSYFDDFPNTTGNGTKVSTKDVNLFPTTLGRSYLCGSVNSVAVGNVTVKFSNLRIQAFRTVNNTDFSSAEECEADDSSDTVIIAVGCALAALVIFVLIAYLIGRRRSRQKGYQSV